MKFPFNHSYYPNAPFTLLQLHDWISLYKPLSIEMDDRQYAHLAHLVGYNPKEYRGVLVKFLEVPAY